MSSMAASSCSLTLLFPEMHTTVTAIVFFTSSSLCKGARVASTSFQEVCLPEAGDSQHGQTEESDYKMFSSFLC